MKFGLRIRCETRSSDLTADKVKWPEKHIETQAQHTLKYISKHWNALNCSNSYISFSQRLSFQFATGLFDSEVQS